jgi:hypothetical protein
MTDDVMPRGTSYRVVPLKDKSYGVEVLSPHRGAWVMDSFQRESDAEAWIKSQLEKTAEAHPV